MENSNLKELKSDVIESFARYKLSINDEWWEKYLNILDTYSKWPEAHKNRPSPTDLRKSLESLQNTITKHKYRYREYSKPDLFEDDSDVEYQELCRNLESLIEDLGCIESSLALVISYCSQTKRNKKRYAKLHSIIIDLSTLIKEIDPNRVGLTYSFYEDQFEGLLVNLVTITCRQLNVTIPQESHALGKAIQRALKSDSWTTVYKPKGTWQTPQDKEKAEVKELSAEGLSQRDIAEALGMSKSKVDRILNR